MCPWPWSLPVLKDRSSSLWPNGLELQVLGLEAQVLGSGLETQVLGLGLEPQVLVNITEMYCDEVPIILNNNRIQHNVFNRINIMYSTESNHVSPFHVVPEKFLAIFVFLLLSVIADYIGFIFERRKISPGTGSERVRMASPSSSARVWLGACRI